jgi:hypothetical protein
MIKNDFSYLKERTYTVYKNLETNEQKIRSIIVNCSTTNKDKKELLHFFNNLLIENKKLKEIIRGEKK